jgi:hypothetical protein
MAIPGWLAVMFFVSFDESRAIIPIVLEIGIA